MHIGEQTYAAMLKDAENSRARIGVLEAALRGVADFTPLADPTGKGSCWCGTIDYPERHLNCCLTARAALAASPEVNPTGEGPPNNLPTGGRAMHGGAGESPAAPAPASEAYDWTSGAPCPHGRTGEDAAWCLDCESDALRARARGEVR